MIFFGIPEEEGKTCDEVLSLFMREHLHMDSPCELINTRRIGHKKADGTRPIITTFIIPTERLKVWGKRFSVISPFGMSEDFPPEIRKARTSLVPQLEELKMQGNGWELSSQQF